MRSEPRSARTPVWALSISLAATLEITVVFSSSGYLDVSVHRVPSVYLWIQHTVRKVFLRGFPHSDICGSQCICHSPQLFAAYHVFHRLSVPRHPPCALSCLTNSLKAVLFGLKTAEARFRLSYGRIRIICEAKDTKKALPSSNRFSFPLFSFPLSYLSSVADMNSAFLYLLRKLLNFF